MPYSVTFLTFSNHENGRFKPAWLLTLSKNVTVPLREVLHFNVSGDQIRNPTLPFWGMLKKAASGVLALLPCSRTMSTLRASKWLRPCWTDFFEHSLPLTMRGSSEALLGYWSTIFNRIFFHLSYRPLELTALGAAEPEPRIDPFGEVV
jgi:hypothetical protein